MALLRSAGWLAYQCALGAGLVAAAPWLAARGRGVGHYLPTLRRRLTLSGDRPGEPTDDEPGPPLWIHAVSVGEVGVAATFVEALDRIDRHVVPLVVTTVTPTGQARAQALFGERPGARVDYLPFDLAPLVERFLRRHEPAALILVEGDYWPVTLREARRRHLPIGVVNGRVSDRAFGRQRRLGSLNDLFYAPVDRFCMQTAEDRDRLVALGAPAERVEVTGNLKFDAPRAAPRPDLEAMVSTFAAGRPVLVAGSTMEGEEDLVLDALSAAGIGTDRDVLLVLAPRHPERWEGVAARLAARGVSFVRRSRADEPRVATDSPGVLLLDTLGELATIYGHGDIAFVGGTLVATGGHNPLEPARLGVPTTVGPSMHNFQAIADQLDRAEAWGRADDAAALGALWRRWLDEPATARAVGERGRRLVEASRGAAERSVERLRPLLEPAGLWRQTQRSSP